MLQCYRAKQARKCPPVCLRSTLIDGPWERWTGSDLGSEGKRSVKDMASILKYEPKVGKRIEEVNVKREMWMGHRIREIERKSEQQHLQWKSVI